MAKALPVLKLTEKSFEINADNFKSVLTKVGDRPFAVISINGTTRTGKSYILSHFVRYFESKKRDPGCKKWYENASCANFEWQSGLTRTTTGINLWSEPYFVKKNNGEEIAVLLLDTQGLFDKQTTARQNVIIFAISTLCSSVMIFNVMRMIDESLLQELEFFSGYAHLTSISQSETNNEDENGEGEGEGRSINSESSYKHGSHLQFLIRDFEIPEQYGYGVHTRSSNPPDKDNLFQDTMLLHDQPDAAEENMMVRENILRSFRDVSIYSLPDPGKEFKTQKGKTIAPDTEFRDNVISFVEYMVEEKNLVKKTVLERPVSGSEFQKYIDCWSKMCENAGELFPEVLTVADNTAFTQFSIAMNLGVSKYKNDMDRYVREKLGSATPEELEAMHTKLKSEAKSIFLKSRKARHPKFEERFTNELETNIEHCYELCKVSNNMLKEVVEKSEKNEKMLQEKLQEMDKRMAEERVEVQGMVRGLNKINETLQSQNKQLSIEMKEKAKEYQKAMDRNQKTMDELQKTNRELNQKTNAMQEENTQALKKNEMDMERIRQDNLKLQTKTEELHRENKKEALEYKKTMEQNQKSIEQLQRTNQDLNEATNAMRQENARVLQMNEETLERMREDNLNWQKKVEDLQSKGATPAFLNQVGYLWVSYDGVIPPNAFEGGVEDGVPLYIGRGTYEGDLLPGKLHSQDGILYVPWGASSNVVQGYEIRVLVARPGALQWQASSYGATVKQAVIGGQTIDGEELYIGRVSVNGNLIIGKIHRSHDVCYIPYHGNEVSYSTYQVLCKV